MAAFWIALAALFPIMNPIAALPLFSDLTGGMDAKGKARTARTTAISVLVIVLVSAVGGKYLLQALGVSLPSLQVAGGVVVGLAGLRMISGTDKRVRPSERPASAPPTGAIPTAAAAPGSSALAPPAPQSSVGVVPLAIPMIAGPGAISVAVALAGRYNSVLATVAIVAAGAVMALLVFLVLRFGEPLLRKIGTTGIGVLTRVFGLVILSIAVELVAEGVTQLFPALAH